MAEEPRFDVWLALPRFKDLQPHSRIAAGIDMAGVRYLKSIMLLHIHVELSRNE
jgi:hypothetical protein